MYEDAERYYYLSTIGKILARRLIDFDDTAETLHTFESFWLEHDLSAIPGRLLDKIGWLKDSRIISGTPMDVFKAYSTVVKLMKDAKKMKAILSVHVPAKLLFDMFATEKDMHVILTEEVLNPYLEDIGREQLRKVLEMNVKLYMIKQNQKIGIFTVTDRFVSLGPHHLDGTFSFSSHLISCNKTAIDWGLALFDHYAEIAERVDLS